MTKRPFTVKRVRAKECLELVHIMCVNLLMSKHMKGMIISSPSHMITLGMVMFTLCIGNPMSWLNLWNLRWNRRTN